MVADGIPGRQRCHSTCTSLTLAALKCRGPARPTKPSLPKCHRGVHLSFTARPGMEADRIRHPTKNAMAFRSNLLPAGAASSKISCWGPTPRWSPATRADSKNLIGYSLYQNVMGHVDREHPLTLLPASTSSPIWCGSEWATRSSDPREILEAEVRERPARSGQLPPHTCRSA